MPSRSPCVLFVRDISKLIRIGVCLVCPTNFVRSSSKSPSVSVSVIGSPWSGSKALSCSNKIKPPATTGRGYILYSGHHLHASRVYGSLVCGVGRRASGPFLVIFPHLPTRTNNISSGERTIMRFGLVDPSKMFLKLV
jgi:hypothetical protein